MISALEIIIEAKKLIEKPGGWTQHSFARDAKGEHSTYKDGVSFCAVGACQKVLGENLFKLESLWALNDAVHALRKSTSSDSLGHWNDEEGRTQKEVVRIFERAQKMLEVAT